MIEFIRKSGYLFIVTIFACTCLYNLHSLSEENRSLTQQHVELQQKQSVLLEDIKTYESKYADLRSNKEEVDAKHRELEKSTKEQEDMLKQQKKILGETQEKLVDAIHIIINVSQAMGFFEGKDHIETYRQVKNNFRSFIDEIRNLKGVDDRSKKEGAKYSLLQKRYSDMKSEHEVLAQELKEAEETISKLQNEIDKAKSEKEKVVVKRTAKETKLVSKKTEIQSDSVTNKPKRNLRPSVNDTSNIIK